MSGVCNAAEDAAQAAATKQLQSEVPQKLEQLQSKLEEAEKRSADFKRAQQASSDAAQAHIAGLEAQVRIQICMGTLCRPRYS
jgi:uncharacterized protein involved in exopolysaccharide biosynthesis